MELSLLCDTEVILIIQNLDAKEVIGYSTNSKSSIQPFKDEFIPRYTNENVKA